MYLINQKLLHDSNVWRFQPKSMEIIIRVARLLNELKIIDFIV